MIKMYNSRLIKNTIIQRTVVLHLILWMSLVSCGGGGGSGGSSSTSGNDDILTSIDLIDTHAHINADANNAGSFQTAIDDLKDIAADQGMFLTLLMPPPFKSTAKESHYQFNDPAWLDPINAESSIHFLAGGGLLSPILAGTTNSDGTVDTVKAANQESQFISYATEIAESSAAGFGEIALLHFSLAETHDFIQVAPNHPLMLKLAEIAISYDMPIDVHMEVVETAEDLSDLCINLPDTQNPCSDNTGSCVCDIRPTFPEFRELLDTGATIVWAHVGWDNTGAMDLDLLRDLLANYDNLYLQLRGKVDADLDNRIFDNAGQLKAEWKTFIQDFPDRFVVGTDHFYDPPGIPLEKPQLYEGSRMIVDAVAEFDVSIAEKIAYKNAQMIYRGLE